MNRSYSVEGRGLDVCSNHIQFYSILFYYIIFVESLLKLPMDPDATSANGRSALSVSACNGQESVARLLLEAGASKDLAQQEAIYLEVVRLLLGSGADKDLAANNGATAHMVASEDGHLDPCVCC